MIDTHQSKAKLGWNWIWFLPMCLVVICFTELHAVHLVSLIIPLVRKRWTWGVLLSPSAYLCLTVMLFSVFLPIQAVLIAAAQFLDDTRTLKHRYIVAIAVLVGVFLILPFITDTLIWGSFPLTYDNSGIGRLRMIPFIPWPTGGYMTF